MLYSERSLGGLLISQSQVIQPVGDWYTTESVTHGQCDARPTVTFPAIDPHRRMAGTNLYCLVNRGTLCEQLGQGILEIVWFVDSKVKVTGSVSAFFHTMTITPMLTDNSNTAWVWTLWVPSTGWRKNGPSYLIANILKTSWPNCVEILQIYSCFLTHYSLLWCHNFSKFILCEFYWNAVVVYSHCTNRFEHHRVAVFSLGGATAQWNFQTKS